MVLYVAKWNIRPEKLGAYANWGKSTIQRLLAVPGVVEVRGYRAATGAHYVVVTYEFADMAAWAAWSSNEDVQKMRDELDAYATDVTYELWGPSPVIPKPIKPGK